MSPRSRPPHRRPPRRGRTRPPSRPSAEPDLLEEVGARLTAGEPLPLLELASTVLSVLDPARHGLAAHSGGLVLDPDDPDLAGLDLEILDALGRSPSPLPSAAEPGSPGRDTMLEALFGAAHVETSALLLAIACLSGDDLLQRRAQREVAARGHQLPSWLTTLRSAVPHPGPVEWVHVLGDGDDVLVSTVLPGGHPLTAVVYVDHNMGTIVKDAFVLPESLDGVLDALRQAAVQDGDGSALADIEVRTPPPADVRARIAEAIDQAASLMSPVESDTWPACRPLIDWIVDQQPVGGRGYPRPEWDAGALEQLADRALDSPYLRESGDPGVMLPMLVELGAQYPPFDPLRISPVAVEVLLVDRIPHHVLADPDDLITVPDVLRGFIRFCHAERGIRPELTAQTLAAVDEFAPTYRRLLADRPPEMSLSGDPHDEWDEWEDEPFPASAQSVVGSIMLPELARAVGGRAVLDALDADPLPDEPFAVERVDERVRPRIAEILALVEDTATTCFPELPEFAVACRRLLADVAVGDPELLRRGRPAIAATTVCWLVGRANVLFESNGGTPHVLTVTKLVEHCGVAANSVSQRAESLLRAIGTDAAALADKQLRSPRYLLSARRSWLISRRDLFLE